MVRSGCDGTGEGCGCFARDGLQHEDRFIPTEEKVALHRCALLPRVFRASRPRATATPTGFRRSADASAVLRGIQREPGARYKATCANLHSVRRAIEDLDAGVRRDRAESPRLGDRGSHATKSARIA